MASVIFRVNLESVPFSELPIFILKIERVSTMVVGRGMVANGFFSNYENNENYCIYASGVSNSSCIDKGAFDRERLLLESTLKRVGRFCTLVYISTCSIVDMSLSDTPYVHHKIMMEEMVLAKENTLVFRFPIVVGESVNPNTLFNFLWRNITNGKNFLIWAGARRNVIDISDACRISDYLLKREVFKDRIINVANLYDYSIFEIVKAMELISGKKGRYKVEEKNSSYFIDVAPILDAIEKIGLKFNGDYLSNVIFKYYKNKLL